MNENKNITIPKPFSFYNSNKENKSITQIKYQEMINEKEKELKEYENWRFRANPVPAECLAPLMHTLDAERLKRLEDFKK